MPRSMPVPRHAMDASADPNRPIRASMIVLNYEGRDVLGACLESLVADVGPDDEIIVVDNGSRDGSDRLVAEHPSVRLVQLPSNTYIFGLNAGLVVARGEFVGFLNNDIVVEPGFTDALVAGFDGADVFAVCARILDPRQREQGSRTSGFWAHGVLHYEPLDHSPVATDCFFAVGGQSLFRRVALDEIGSIDPLLWPMYHEDIELSYRAWKRGWRVRYAPDAVVHHLGSHTSNRVFQPGQLRAFVRQNEFLTVWKDVTDRRLLAQHVAYLAPRLLKAAITGDRPTLHGFARAVRRAPRVLPARRAARLHFARTDHEVLALVDRAHIDGRPTPTGADPDRARRSVPEPSGPGVVLEDVPCPVCGSPERTRVLTAADELHHLPGSWDVYACRRCPHAYTSPRPIPASIGAYYPDAYREHQEASTEPNRFSLANADVVRRVRPIPGRVLDVGCAAGAFLEAMGARGWDTMGVEPSAAAAERARRSTGSPVFASLDDDGLDELPRPDVVTLWSVLEHAHDPGATLRRVRSLVAADGHLIGVVPNFASLERRVFGRRWFALDVPRHLQQFSPASLVRVLCDAGFEVVDVGHASGHDTFRWSVDRLVGREPRPDLGAAEVGSEGSGSGSGTAAGRSVASRAKGFAVSTVTSTADRAGFGSQLTFVARPSASPSS